MLILWNKIDVKTKINIVENKEKYFTNSNNLKNR